MSRQNRIDELDEMLLPGSIQEEIDKKAAQGDAATKKPQQVKQSTSRKRAKKGKGKSSGDQATYTFIGIGAALFVVLLIVLCVMGMAGNGNGSTPTAKRAQPDPDKTSFLNESNIPELSSEGVKGLLKQAYYTVDGKLAVVLNLSNGTASEQKVVRINATVFNDKQETVAQQTIDRFDPECFVEAMGYGEVYFEIDRQNVVLRDDPLSKLGVTLEIASSPTDGSAAQTPQGKGPVVGDGPKDIAAGRSHYENLGNLPAMSEEGVKASIIRARYTNDGSLAVALSFSNGTAQKQQVSKVDFLLQNANGETIAEYTFDRFETPCQVDAKSYTEMELMVESGYVLKKDDPLSTLSCTISVSAGPIA